MPVTAAQAAWSQTPLLFFAHLSNRLNQALKSNESKWNQSLKSFEQDLNAEPGKHICTLLSLIIQACPAKQSVCPE